MGAVVLGGVEDEIPRGRAAGWAALVGVLAVVGYATRIAGGAPDRDVLYRYSTAVGAVIQFAVIGGVLLALARRLDLARVLALRSPRSWRRGLGYSALALAAVWVVGLALSPFLDAGKDQGLVPKHWEPSHAGAYAANFVVITLLAPLVEETTFRGFGMSVVEPRFGPAAAVVVTALAWGLAHGLTAGLPVLVAFGVILGVVRLRTGSVLPGMLTHATFNAISLIVAVTVGTSS
jgi:membrane protease YdiL (CAAX protease family)